MVKRKKRIHHTSKTASHRPHTPHNTVGATRSIIAGNRLWVKQIIFFSIGILFGIIFLMGMLIFQLDKEYENRVYPGISANGTHLDGLTKEKILELFSEKSTSLASLTLTLAYEDTIATISGAQLDLSYDGAFTATQALSFGRTGMFLTDIRFKLESLLYRLRSSSTALITLPAILSYESAPIDETLANLSQQINVSPVEPLFEFNPETQRVTAFQLGKNGRMLDEIKTKEQIDEFLTSKNGESEVIPLPVSLVEPKTKTDNVDNLGIVDRIGHGESFYRGSIPGRVHNVILAADRASGVLVPPGDVYSFNNTVGDISAATGYESAYIIKNGRTVLGDGGGVCQVSTTIFRAALNAGLEIIERKAHSYRVAYYEQGGYKPGMDATVYAPSTDLVIKNNTPNYILIQSHVVEPEQKLEFDIYGKNDGRTVTISDTRIWDQSPPPLPLYQDDPTLAPGVVKQVDWAASGAKTAFDYLVIKNGETLQETTFNSNFQPWQAVYLKGPAL